MDVQITLDPTLLVDEKLWKKFGENIKNNRRVIKSSDVIKLKNEKKGHFMKNSKQMDYRKDIARNKTVPINTKIWLKLWRSMQNTYNSGGGRMLTLLKIVYKIIFWNLSCEINYKCKIDEGLRVPHLLGIVISQYASIGKNCTIFHNVTIGANEKIKNGPCAPTIGDNVYIGAGATLIGAITVGDNAVIGANATVTENVPAGATIVGINRRLT